MAVLHDKQQYGEGIATAVKKTLEGAGIKVALFEGINAGDKDFSAMIAKLKQASVDFVYFGGYHPEMGLILRQAAEKGPESRASWARKAWATRKSPPSPARLPKACW